MPICKQCNDDFPNYAIIDGKQRDFRRRTYCLECSPFGTRTKTGPIKTPTGTKCTCKLCGQEYSFHKSVSRLDTCRSCLDKYRRKKLKQEYLDYLGGSCIVCGYNKSTYAIDFHHVDPSTKSYGISTVRNSSLNSVKSELDKCVPLCRNCHAEYHAGEISLPNEILSRFNIQV